MELSRFYTQMSSIKHAFLSYCSSKLAKSTVWTPDEYSLGNMTMVQATFTDRVVGFTLLNNLSNQHVALVIRE